MTDALAGRTIVVPERRELDLFARMLEQHGAITIRCPMVAISDVPDAAPVVTWLRRFTTDPPDDLILMTGEGLGGESAKPCYNRSRIRHVRYGDHRAADRYCAVLLYHAREQIEFASFWNHNRSAGQGICHLSSRRKIVTPPLFARKIERDCSPRSGARRTGADDFVRCRPTANIRCRILLCLVARRCAL